MGGQILSNPGLDPTSVQAWRERRTIEIDLGGGVAVRVKKYDTLALIGAQNGVPNPLMAIVSSHMGNTESAGKAIMQDPAKLDELRTMLNDAMKKLIIAPPLIENGQADGISVDEFTVEEKMLILFEAGGGERLDAAKTFLAEQGASLVLAPDGGAVRPDPGEAA